jgi:hypothetical protein
VTLGESQFCRFAVSILVSLALIPLALTGACILFVVSWWLLPYAMVLFGGLLLAGGMSMDASQTGSLGLALGLTGAALLSVGGLWSRERYASRRGRR